MTPPADRFAARPSARPAEEFDPYGHRQPSRAEGLERGLLDSPAVPEDFEQVRDRSIDWYRAFKPRTDFHAWLVDQVTVLSLRVDRSQRIERRLRDRHSLRAELAWDLDRRQEAEALGSKLARKPAEVAVALRRTPQGCDWLIRRWELLARSAETQGRWTPEQASVAIDLLGIPAEFRAGVEAVGDPAELARRELAGLAEARAVAARLGEVDRALAMADLSDESNHELGRLRRHESSLHRRIHWCLAQLRYEWTHKGPGPEIRPRWALQPGPEVEEPSPPAPESAVPESVSPHPPFDLELDEDPGPGQALDVPRILAGRQLKQERKAQARREARRRKLERLRA